MALSSSLPVHDLVVVGAGIGGLAAAWRAAAAGRDVLVLEAGERAGGVIETVRLGAYRVERAAATLPSTARHVLDLLATLPGAPRALPARPEADRQLLLTRTGLVAVPRSPPAFLATRLLPPGAKLRLLAEVLRGPRRGARSETLERFVRRRFGTHVAERFLVPFTRGIYGAHPSRLGAGDAFPLLPALERRGGSVVRGMLARLRERRRPGPRARRAVLLLEGGMQALPRALAAALGERLWLRAPVRALAPADPADPGGHAVLTLAAGDRVAAREVLLACPARAQAALVAPFAPGPAEALSGVAAAPIAVVAVGLPPGNPPVPEAFGFLRGHGARARLLGATFHSRLSDAVAPPGHDLVLAFVGGTEDPDALALGDAELAEVVLRDLSRALGGTLRPDLVDVHRWPAAIPLFSPGHRGRMAAVAAALSRWGVRLGGSHVTGVGVDACVGASTPG